MLLDHTVGAPWADMPDRHTPRITCHRRLHERIAKTSGHYISLENLDIGLEPFRKIRRAVGDKIAIMLEMHALWNLPFASLSQFKALTHILVSVKRHIRMPVIQQFDVNAQVPAIDEPFQKPDVRTQREWPNRPLPLLSMRPATSV